MSRTLEPFGEPGDNAAPEFRNQDVALLVGAAGASFLPRAMRDLSPAGQRVAARLQLLARRRLDLEDELEAAVLEARAAGLSWASIGWCWGLTGEAVRKAYSD